MTNTKHPRKDSADFVSLEAARNFADGLIKDGKTDEQPEITESRV